MSQQQPDSRRQPLPDDDTRAGSGPRIGSATSLEAPGPSASPFIWQEGSRLLLLVREVDGWVLAELRFVTPECRYLERRRARYAWPREAAGALIALAVTADHAARGRLARAVAKWIAEVSPESIAIP